MTMMNCRFFKACVVATAMIFVTSLVPLSMAWASPSTSKDVDLEITVRVNQKGFLDQKGKVFGPKNILKLPHDKVVRITFVFDEKMSSLKESGKIWMFNQKTSIAFQVGKEGVQYRAYCILDCIGMEHLNNLVIQVV
jgi:hypothetical protein